MKKMKKLFLLLFLAVFTLSAQLKAQSISVVQPDKSSYTVSKPYETVRVKKVKGKKAKNVVMMIGDGMGLVQVSAAWVANHGSLNIDNCSYSGFSRTWCSDKLITDSGAAGTAMATGSKTNYHSISVDTRGEPLNALTDFAHSAGLSTGIVVTCNLTDATPSVFCANNVDRDREEEIASDYMTSNVDYIFGAGREKFNKRTDGRDLLDEMKNKGYQVCTSWAETEKITGGRVFSVPSEGQLPFAKERGDIFGKAVMHCLGILNQNKKGFFAMFEGSRIDDCGHSNNMPALIEEVFDFDRTIGQVLQWAEKDGNTLVIILADHETGGLTLLDGNISTGTVKGSFSTTGHSGILVPVYAYGPGAEEFTGIYENTDVFKKIAALLKLEK
jgi:alkaline phosphatase